MGYSWSQQDQSVGAGFQRIATEQIAKAIINADAVGDPPAGRIHSARRHCKRLRGLFRLVRSDFGEYRHANAEIRDAAALLSTVRDAAVLCGTLEKLYTWAGYPVPANLDRHTVDPEAEVAALTAFRKAMSKLLADAEGWKLQKVDRQTLSRGFGRYYAQAAKAARHCRRNPSDEGFHEWRKLVKYHSFHLILLKSCLADGVGGDIERIEHLAELLGRHHDLAMLRQTARTAPEKLGGHLDEHFIETNAGHLQDHLAARAFVLADEIFARPSATVRNSLETRWDAWWQPAAMTEPA